MKTPELIQFIGRALNSRAASYREIRDRVNAMSVEQVNYQQVAHAIMILRRADPDEWGWTIPHCKRGPSSPGRLWRMSAALPSPGVFYSQDRMAATEIGIYGTALSNFRQQANIAKFLEIEAENAPPHKKRLLRRLKRTADYMAEQLSDMADDLAA